MNIATPPAADGRAGQRSEDNKIKYNKRELGGFRGPVLRNEVGKNLL